MNAFISAIPVAAVTVIIFTCIASLFEWTLHRFLMHKPVRFFLYPYKAHHLVHHRIFRSDDSYHLMDEADKHTIPMAWWNGIVMVELITLASMPITFRFEHYITIQTAIFATVGAYYGVYEYIHWCMHLPRKRNIERSGIFFRLNGHHLLHHRYMNKNFNVVLPLADLCLGTLLLRSKVSFRQARGPSIPNVQPKDAWPRIPTIGNNRVGMD